MTTHINTSNRYGSVAIALHWILALGLIALFCFGLYMVNLPFSPLRLKLFNWHKWAGVTVLILSTVRLAWRLTHPAPDLPAKVLKAMPTWQVTVHTATHGLLYLLFFIVPIIGWAYSSAAGFSIVLFGQFPLPDLLSADPAMAAMIKPLHKLSAFALAGLSILHIAAALKHQLIDKDGLIERMLPSRR